MVFKNICILVLRTKVIFAMEGLRVFPAIVVWILDTFQNNFGIGNGFTKCLLEKSWLCFFQHFSFKYFPIYAYSAASKSGLEGAMVSK